MLIEDPTDDRSYLFSFYSDNSQHTRVVSAKAGQEIPVTMEFNFDNIATRDWSVVAWGTKGGAITVTHAEGTKSDTLPFIQKKGADVVDPVDPPAPTPKPKPVDPTPKPVDPVDPPTPKPVDPVEPTPTPKPVDPVDPPTPKPADGSTRKEQFNNFVENLEESGCLNWHQFD